MKINLIIIGCGGTGSYLDPVVRYLYYKTNLQEICLIDGDILEERNLGRQNFPNNPTEKVSKAEALLSRYKQFCCPKKAVKRYVLDLREFTNANKDVTNIVISSVDNLYSRKRHIETLLQSDINFVFITPGNDYDFGQVISFARISGVQEGINPLDQFDHWANTPNDAPKNNGNNCHLEAYNKPQLITANVFSAALVLYVLTNLLEKDKLCTWIKFELFNPFLVAENIELVELSLEGKKC
jgi:hypothetical protein